MQLSVDAKYDGNLPSLNGLSQSGFTTLHLSIDNDVGVSGKPTTFTSPTAAHQQPAHFITQCSGKINEK